MAPNEIPIHFCVTGGRAIFLDLRRNRYFALASAVNDAFVSKLGDIKFGVIDGKSLHDLAGGSVPKDLPIGSPSALNARTVTEPQSDCLAVRCNHPVSLGSVLAAWLAFLIAKTFIRFCPLHLILGTLRKNANEVIVVSKQNKAVARLGSAFCKLNLWIGSDGNCLPLTLAFVWLSRYFGYNPALVIGVRLNPFSAHCWSQEGATVLNDAFERVRLYQPILVV